MTGLHSNCIPEEKRGGRGEREEGRKGKGVGRKEGEDRRKENRRRKVDQEVLCIVMFTFGISIDELAL